MAGYYSRFTTWVMGYTTKKAVYPMEWAGLSPAIFSDSRVLALSTGSGVHQQVGASVARLKEIFLERGTFAVNEATHTVYAEIYSKTSEKRRVIQFDWQEMSLSACTIDVDGTEIVSTTPIQYASLEAGSGAPFCATILLGFLMQRMGAEGKDLSGAIKHLNDMFKIDVEAVTSADELSIFSEWDGIIYRDIKDNNIKGVGSDGLLARLSVDDVMGFAKEATPFVLVGAEKAAPSIIWGESAAREEYDLDEDSKSPEDYVKMMQELHEELLLPIHKLSEEEKKLVPQMDKNYVPPEVLVNAARSIRQDWGKSVGLAPNFILEGDAGSGKTTGSIFWAYVFGIPRTKMTMSPTFESANLIGAFYPVFRDMDDWDISETDRKVLKKVKEIMEKDEFKGSAPKSRDLILSMRKALANEGVRSLIRDEYGIPSEEEIAFDPDGVWHDLGNTTPAPGVEEVTLALHAAFQDKMFRLMGILSDEAEKGSVSYQFIISELLKAFQNGWLVEIQEAASVLRPGVLTELNSLLEPNGSIELPNGSRIYRHPDTIVIITTNRGYAGNVELNESLRDRCVMGIKMDTPSAEEMAARAMARTGLKSKTVALAAAKTMKAIEEEAKSKCIRGSYGMRSLLGWMTDLARDDFSEDAFMRRVVYKMTTDDDDVETLRACYRANCRFASKVKMGKTTRI